MPASEAQIAANRANALKSTGPRTPEGKARSRANAYRHGMAGNGIVLSPTDAAEVARRSAAMQAEMRPRCEMGRFFVDRLARLTVRVERCAETEDAAVEYLAVHAHAAFDESRIAEVDHAIEWIAAEPSVNARKLRSMPEGVDRLIATLLDLREAVDVGLWAWTEGDKLSLLMGRKYMESPTHRVRALSEAITGDFQHLLESEGGGLSLAERVDWARVAMGGLIDDEIRALLAHRETLDLGAIESDRATAPVRAKFDPSKEAILARRYEAAAERAVYKALNEFRRVEAEAEQRGPAEAAPEAGDEAEGEELGSCGKASRGPYIPPRPEAPEAPMAPARPVRAAPGCSTVALTVGRPPA